MFGCMIKCSVGAGAFVETGCWRGGPDGHGRAALELYHCSNNSGSIFSNLAYSRKFFQNRELAVASFQTSTIVFHWQLSLLWVFYLGQNESSNIFIKQHEVLHLLVIQNISWARSLMTSRFASRVLFVVVFLACNLAAANAHYNSAIPFYKHHCSQCIYHLNMNQYR